MTARLQRQFFRPDVARDVDEELASHLEMYEADLLDKGVPAPEAHEMARRRFGDPARVARACRDIDEAWYRDQRRSSMWTDLAQDIGYALRLLRRAPGFAAVAIVTLALGIGATTAVFTLTNWALLRPVPGVMEPDRVLQVWSGIPKISSFTPSFLSYPNFMDMAARVQTVSLAGMQRTTVNVGRGQSPARPVPSAFTTASYFDVLGIRMAAGRPYNAAEDTPGQTAPVVVVSERFARSTFGSAADAIRQVLQINGVACTIIGVAERTFAGTDRMAVQDLWLPVTLYPVVNHMTKVNYSDRRSGGFYEMVARLKPGVERAQAEAELKSMAAWLKSEYPDVNARFATVGFHIMGPIGGTFGRAPVITMTKLMFGVSAIVLLIACSNVASLLMMRGVRRGGEIAVRKALGAARFRIVRQHLTEGAVLWTIAGGLALFVVWTWLRTANGVALLGQRGEAVAGVPLDLRVVGFATVLSLIVGLIFSVAPALRALRVEPAGMLRQGTLSGSGRNLKVGTVLSAVQLALSLTLLVGALLMAATIRHLSGVDLGFKADGLYAFTIRPNAVGYSRERALAYRDEFARQLKLVPGVESVAIALRAPFVASRMTTLVKAEGAEDAVEPNATEILTPDYFETLRIPLRSGRYFTVEDLGAGEAPARDVVIVSELLARRLFGDAGAIGRTLEFGTMGRKGKRYEIVGVVGDVRFDSVIADPDPMVYEPAAISPPVRPDGTFVVRAAPGVDVAQAVRTLAASLNPALPVVMPTSMPDAVSKARGEWEVLARMVTGLAIVAGSLAAVGLYGVVAFGVAAQRREFGIRLALGAPPSGIVALVLRRTAIITAAGLLLGSIGAVTLTRALQNRLFGVTPFDPVVWGLAATLLIGMAVAASWIPARRAASVEVTRALRAL